MATVCQCCGISTEQEALYKCNSSGCTINNILCESCGDFAHQRAKTNHQFSEHKIVAKQNDGKQEMIQSSKPAFTENKNDDKEEQLPSKNKTQNMPIIDIFDDINVTPSSVAYVSAAAAAVTGIGISGIATCGLSTGLQLGIGSVAAMFYAKSAKSFYDKLYPNKSEQKYRLQTVAFKLFQFHEEDLKNENVFNAKEIERRYHRFAKYYHPDKGYNREKYFRKIEISRRILLSMINPEYNFPDDAQQILNQDNNFNQSIKKQLTL